MKTKLMARLVVCALSAGAASANEKIMVITSFPDSMTGPI